MPDEATLKDSLSHIARQNEEGNEKLGRLEQGLVDVLGVLLGRITHPNTPGLIPQIKVIQADVLEIFKQIEEDREERKQERRDRAAGIRSMLLLFLGSLLTLICSLILFYVQSGHK